MAAVTNGFITAAFAAIQQGLSGERRAVTLVVEAVEAMTCDAEEISYRTEWVDAQHVCWHKAGPDYKPL
jgi:hypothetical protein